MSDKIQHWNNMYAKPVESIPWEIAAAPHDLTDLIKHRIITGGTALDVACGTGNYSLYLAEKGFEVTGVDFAQNALDIATERAAKLRLPVKFVQGDATKLADVLGNTAFDFILDYSLLHHIAPADVENYAKQFQSLLNPHGKLLMVCYSEKDKYAQGANQATGKYGNDMFYRTRDEIEKLYSDLKEISYAPTQLGKRAHHQGHAFVFEASK
jgi:2-polyprenyl-3-methyl-5-hydroxy-6-metoxy-1,4-benzoquinol methylase